MLMFYRFDIKLICFSVVTVCVIIDYRFCKIDVLLTKELNLNSLYILMLNLLTMQWHVLNALIEKSNHFGCRYFILFKCSKIIFFSASDLNEYNK